MTSQGHYSQSGTGNFVDYIESLRVKPGRPTFISTDEVIDLALKLGRQASRELRDKELQSAENEETLEDIDN